MTSTTFKLRKLCSSTEEYEANVSSPLDLDRIGLYLSRLPGVEISRVGSTLTVLFEKEGVVVRLHPNGRALIQASLREDAEHVCSMLDVVVRDTIGEGRPETRNTQR